MLNETEEQDSTCRHGSRDRLRGRSRAAHLGAGRDGFHANFQWTSALSVASTLGNGFVRLSTRVTTFLDCSCKG